jgi:phage terminase large subunit
MFGCWKIDTVPEPPPGTILRYGIDWGFSVDPLAVIRSWESGDTLYIDYEAGGVGVKIPDTEAKVIEVPGIKSWPVIADSARPEMIDLLNNKGFHIERSAKGKGSIEDGIEDIRGYNVVIDPRCKETIDEFIHYRYKKDPHTGKVLPIIIDANNNYIDALRYSREGVRRKPGQEFDLS